MNQSTKVIRSVVPFSLFIIAISLLLRLMADAFTLAAGFYLILYTFLLLLLRFRVNKTLEYISPLLIVALTYELLPGNADIIVNRVYGDVLFRFDDVLFSPIFGMPPVYYAYIHKNIPLYLICSLFYLSHIIVPAAYGLLLLKKRYIDDYALFISSFSIVSFLAFITFLIFPTSPPWHFFAGDEAVLIAPQIAALYEVDSFLGFPIFGYLYKYFESFPLGAFPSLHAAYPILVQISLWKIYGKRSLLFILYPAAVAFASVYLLHHYIIDVLGSIFYVFAAVVLSEKMLQKHR